MRKTKAACPFSGEAIRSALEKITTSPVFCNAERMTRFISFVVNETLEGRAESLKEYLVGVEVFERGSCFDPRNDTIVRVEARRLRRKLQEYYATAGRTDALIISLPRGSYVPEFRSRNELLSLTAERNYPSVAVLPFADLSPGKDQAYICEGISEELINTLSSIPSLKVAARSSAFRFKGGAEDISCIGSQLRVEHIVTGSVRVSGERIRVSAQLVRAWDGYVVWAREFDRKLTEMFTVQDELARAVAISVASDVGAWIHSICTTNIDAYRAYLTGKHLWRHLAPCAVAEAIAHFERAIAADPAFAPAYAGLADCYIHLNLMGVKPAAESGEKARGSAMRAIELDNSCVEAYAQMGTISAIYDWAWRESERYLKLAIGLQPNYANAHWLLANFCLAPQKRLDEALTAMQQALALDPLSPLVHAMAGAVFWHRRELEFALDELGQALSLDPGFTLASGLKAFVYLSQNRLELAQGAAARAWCKGYIEAKLGNMEAARRELGDLLTKSSNPLAIAATYAGLGELKNSLKWLEKCVEERVPQMIWVLDHPVFESLYGEPAYRRIRDRMNLSPKTDSTPANEGPSR